MEGDGSKIKRKRWVFQQVLYNIEIREAGGREEQPRHL